MTTEQHQVLFVHSSGPQGPGEGSIPFAERLRQELGPEYDVRIPEMPASAVDPHYQPWSGRLGEALAEMETPVAVVGHSLGGSVALKHLVEGRDVDAVAGLVLAAVPYWGTEDWEAEWALPDGEGELPPIFLFQSRDDEEIPADHLERYAARLPGAKTQLLTGNGHLFDRGDLTPVVSAIRSLG
jgi:serine hydrolase